MTEHRFLGYDFSCTVCGGDCTKKVTIECLNGCDDNSAYKEWTEKSEELWKARLSSCEHGGHNYEQFMELGQVYYFCLRCADIKHPYDMILKDRSNEV